VTGHEAGGLRFPKSRRILKRREFLEIQSGVRRGGPEPESKGRSPVRRRRAGRFVVLLRPRTGGQPGRLGVTVSSKVGVAVRRNRIRRLVREAYRTSPDLFPREHDVVVIATTGDGEWTLGTVREELSRWR